MTTKEAKWVTDIVRDAGGTIVGRTRLQKVGFLLELAGVGEGFTFSYRHYGPYSEELATAARTAVLLKSLEEVECPTTWGGLCSIYSTNTPPRPDVHATRRQIAHKGAQTNAIQLELVATALFLAQQGAQDPWAETARRKPEKANVGLAGAKELYNWLKQLETLRALPHLG